MLFTPRFWNTNGREDWAALDIARLAEADGAEISQEAG